ncbi:hypothetical protein D051_1342 [Vibrio parahaemolyticus VPCR-2010]|nr:hypothetical protein D051_1342 [Vibrio parahaemolyticus VPCR-2010]
MSEIFHDRFLAGQTNYNSRIDAPVNKCSHPMTTTNHNRDDRF